MVPEYLLMPCLQEGEDVQMGSSIKPGASQIWYRSPRVSALLEQGGTTVVQERVQWVIIMCIMVMPRGPHPGARRGRLHTQSKRQSLLQGTYSLNGQAIGPDAHLQTGAYTSLHQHKGAIKRM